jgi:hypothetical protein
MPRNKISDLNNHLFAQLEKLNDNDDELKGENLSTEVERARAMSSLASQIISSTKLTLDAMKMANNGEINPIDVPNLLNEKNDD